MGQIYNTKEELLAALLRVAKNNQKQTTSEKIRLNDEDMVETLWAQLENTQTGTQDPNGNVTPNKLGSFYLRTDTNPKEVYYASGTGNTDWVKVNNQTIDGNGISVSGDTVSIGNLKSNTSLSAEQFTYLFENFSSYILKSKSSTTDSDGVGEIEIIKGRAKIKGENEDGTVYSEAYAGRVNGSGVYATDGSKSARVSANELGQAKMSANNGSGTSSISIQNGNIDVGHQGLKGLRNELAPTNLDWDNDDRYIPDIGTIKDNLSLTPKVIVDNVDYTLKRLMVGYKIYVELNIKNLAILSNQVINLIPSGIGKWFVFRFLNSTNNSVGSYGQNVAPNLFFNKLFVNNQTEYVGLALPNIDAYRTWIDGFGIGIGGLASSTGRAGGTPSYEVNGSAQNPSTGLSGDMGSEREWLSIGGLPDISSEGIDVTVNCEVVGMEYNIILEGMIYG